MNNNKLKGGQPAIGTNDISGDRLDYDSRTNNLLRRFPPKAVGLAS